MSVVLTVESVSKRFRVQRNRPGTLKESIIQRLTGRHDEGSIIWALRNITFSVEGGRVLGIIGHNGAGKSTLLRLLCGLGRPTAGHIQSMGQVSGLLELGGGIHPELTGRENIMTAGILNGLTKREVISQENEIVAFAELEEFIDLPVRTYSSGMYLRLAFASAIHFDPDALVIDEVLSVGDSRFQQKCIERLKVFRKSGKTLILTSHDMSQIRNLCDDVLVIEEGQVVIKGDPESAINCYNDLMRQRTEKRSAKLSGEETAQSSALLVENGSRMGTQEAAILAVRLFDTKGKSVDSLMSGEGLTIELEYNLSKPMSDFALTMGIFSETNIKCFETNIGSTSAFLGKLTERGKISCQMPEVPLLPGRYYINVGLYPPDWGYVYDYHWQMHHLDVTGENGTVLVTSGIVALNPVWAVFDA